MSAVNLVIQRRCRRARNSETKPEAKSASTVSAKIPPMMASASVHMKVSIYLQQITIAHTPRLTQAAA